MVITTSELAEAFLTILKDYKAIKDYSMMHFEIEDGGRVIIKWRFEHDPDYMDTDYFNSVEAFIREYLYMKNLYEESTQ